MRTLCRYSLIITVAAVFVCQLTANGQMRKLYSDNLDPENSIKKISFYSASSGYVAFSKWIGSTTDTGRTFTKKFITANNVNFNGYSVNLTFGFIINGVKSLNATTLLAYGHYGLVPAILRSTDGGNTFLLVFHNSFSFYPNSSITDMVFPEGTTTGYAVDADRILKTTNGGVLWNVVYSNAGSSFTNIQALNNNTVFAINATFQNNQVMQSTDAGLNWLPFSLPFTADSYTRSAFFVSTNTGWASLNNGGLYKTTNAGANWTLLNNPAAADYSFDKMYFVNDSVGYALQFMNNIYKTADRGLHWEPFPRDNNFAYLGFSHNDFQFLNISQFWAGGGGGLLELTTNGGGTSVPRAFFTVDVAGNNVSLNNSSAAGYQYKWYLNNALLSTNYSTNYLHDIYRGTDTIKLVVVKGSLSDTSTKYAYFDAQNHPGVPVINSFSPVEAIAGTLVIIKGSAFTEVNSVSFGNVLAGSFSIKNDTTLEAIVSSGASGSVSVSSPEGISVKPGFTFLTPPVINSFSPLSGTAGTLVTINGSNFSTTSANNIVFFGAAKGSVIAATSTQLTVIIPPGATYAPLSVTVNGRTAFSSKSFLIQYNYTGPANENIFTSHTNFPASIFTFNGTLSDFNGDGKVDILVGGGALSVFKNISNDTAILFDSQKNIDLANSSSSVYGVNDLNGDGKPDIFALVNEKYFYFKNISTVNEIKFQAGSQIPSNVLYENTSNIAFEDFNGDGKTDVVTLGRILLNNSKRDSIAFTDVLVPYPTTGVVVDFLVKDFNADNKPDILFAMTYGQYFYDGVVYVNTSMGGNVSFTQQELLQDAYGKYFLAFTTEELNNDNKPDVVGITFDSTVYVFENSTVGNSVSFLPGKILTSYPDISAFTLGDLNKDNKPDIITAPWNPYLSHANKNECLTILENSSNGPINFAPKTDVVYSAISPRQTRFITMADFNGDGYPDIAGKAIFQDSNVLCVYHNLKINEDLNVCAGEATAIRADITGSTYQWQVDTGTGFKNVINDQNITGSNQFILNFKSMPSANYGYKYRCIIDGNKTSKTSVVRVLNIFTGLYDSLWENAGNWSCGFLPDENTEVLVMEQVPLTINSNVTVRKIRIMYGVTTITQGHTLTIKK